MSSTSSGISDHLSVSEVARLRGKAGELHLGIFLERVTV